MGIFQYSLIISMLLGNPGVAAYCLLWSDQHYGKCSS